MVATVILLLLFPVTWLHAYGIANTSVANSGSKEPSKDLLIKTYLKLMGENHAGKWLRKYSSEEQLAGTNLGMVNWTVSKFQEFGLDASIDEYDAYVSYPKDISLGLVKDNRTVYEASFVEDPVDEDPNTKHTRPAFLGYAASGNVTAQYVFCNYGTYEDFQQLEKMGVALSGKIAVVRYGEIFRGLKVKFAQDHGMAGVAIYSDPVDDGNVTVANGYMAYPDGPARNPSSIQRGSVQFLSELPGDPTTPGYAIKPGENKSRSDPYLSIPRIPVIPLSERDAGKILRHLNGHGPAFAGAHGGLLAGFDYSVGPNPAYELSMVNEQNFTTATMHNVLARIEGHNPHEVVIIGNHHDSWTPSAGDPHSGSAVMMELARGLGDLVKIGWKPQRTILLASWDGEEYGLLGSTGFGVYNAKDLKDKAVAYLNIDAAVTGKNLHLQASPLLDGLLLHEASKLPYSARESLQDHFRRVTRGHMVGNLGSGSDYTVFLERLGIPSVDLSFEGNATSSPYQYHSAYDNFDWMSRFGDPGFKFHNLLSKYIGLLVISLSETKVIPLRTADYANKLGSFFDSIATQVPHKWLSSPLFNTTCPHFKNITVGDIVADVNDQIAKLKHSNIHFDQNLAKQQHSYDHWDELSLWEKVKLMVAIHRSNISLKYYERRFLKDEGLKYRPWFKHVVFASGRHTGYAGQQLPEMTEALEDGKRDDFVEALSYFDRLLNRLTL